MDINDIMKLWDRFEGSSADVMEVTLSGDHFKLKKNPKAVAMPPAPVPMPVMAGSIPMPAQEAPSAATEEHAPEAADENAIHSPLAGTFYRSSSPGEEPFISIGDQIHKGDVIGVVEAMKLFNEVKSNRDGVVRQIMAEDGELVEYNQTLVLLD